MFFVKLFDFQNIEMISLLEYQGHIVERMSKLVSIPYVSKKGAVECSTITLVHS